MIKQIADLVTISVYSDNTAGVLHRIATSFTKRKINIETLTVSETSEKGISLFTITVRVDPHNLAIILKQIERIVEVRRAFSVPSNERVTVEIALVRIKLDQKSTKSDIEDIIKDALAKVIYEENDNLIVEFQGTEGEVKILYNKLSKFEILQFVTSGPIALAKKFRSIHS